MGHSIDVLIVRRNAPGLGRLRAAPGFWAMPLDSSLGGEHLLLIAVDLYPCYSSSEDNEDGESKETGEPKKIAINLCRFQEEETQEEFVCRLANVVGDQVAYARSDYFGGPGEQSSCVAQPGVGIVLPYQTAGGGVVNEALRLFGVIPRGGYDEWDSVGLDRIRGNRRIKQFGKSNPAMRMVPNWTIQRLFYIAINKFNEDSSSCPLSTLPRVLVPIILSLAVVHVHSDFTSCGCSECGNVKTILVPSKKKDTQ